MSILSSNLKLLREEARYSQAELARLVDATEKDINDWETGVKIPSATTLMKLCKYLKAPFDDIIERDFVSERSEALKNMKKAQKTKNGDYEWYFGNPKWRAFYISYIIYFFLGLCLAVMVGYFIYKNVDFNILQSYNPHKTLLYIKCEFIISETISILGVFGLGAGIFYLIHFFRSHEFTFRLWYLFWLSLLFAVVSIVGVVMAVPMLVISIKKLIRIKR